MGVDAEEIFEHFELLLRDPFARLWRFSPRIWPGAVGDDVDERIVAFKGSRRGRHDDEGVAGEGSEWIEREWNEREWEG